MFNLIIINRLHMITIVGQDVKANAKIRGMGACGREYTFQLLVIPEHNLESNSVVKLSVRKCWNRPTTPARHD